MLIFLEGFETCKTDDWLALRYTAGGSSVTSTTGRNGGTGVFSSANTGSTLLRTVLSSATGTLIVGFAVKLSAAPSASGKFGVTLTKAGVAQVTLRLIESGEHEWKLELRRGGAAGTVIETQASAQYVGKWHYIELKVLSHLTTGTYDVQVDGASVMSDTNVDTAGSGAGDLDGIQWRLSTSGIMDDCYVCDTTGGVNDDFLGAIAIEGLLPNANGNQNDWTPSTAGQNYTTVDEDGTGALSSDRVVSSTIGHVDLYSYGALSLIVGSPTFIGLALESVAGMATSGTRGLQPRVRHAGSEVAGTAFSVSSGSQVESAEVFEENPVAASAWTVADINAIEFGIEVAS